MELPHLLAQIGSETRLSLIELLHQRPMGIQELSDDLYLSSNDVITGLNLLVDSGLVETTSGGEYNITGFGTLVWEDLAPLRYIAANHDFLITHDLGLIPLNLQRSIDRLARSSIISARSEAFEDVKRHWQNISGEFSIISEAISPDLAASMAKMVANDVKVRCLLPRGSNAQALLDIRSAHRNRLDLRALAHGRMLLHVSSDYALLALKKRLGGSDPEHIIVATDPDSISWCRDLFAHHWARSAQF